MRCFCVKKSLFLSTYWPTAGKPRTCAWIRVYIFYLHIHRYYYWWKDGVQIFRPSKIAKKRKGYTLVFWRANFLLLSKSNSFTIGLCSLTINIQVHNIASSGIAIPEQINKKCKNFEKRRGEYLTPRSFCLGIITPQDAPYKPSPIYRKRLEIDGHKFFKNVACQCHEIVVFSYSDTHISGIRVHGQMDCGWNCAGYLWELKSQKGAKHKLL